MESDPRGILPRLPEGLPMRAGLAGLLTLALTSVPAAQSRQSPTFRSGVELLQVEASVVDGRSRPVANLQASDFVVTVDGRPRRVVSAEFVLTADPDARQVRRPPAGIPPVSVNDERQDGRLIVLAVDAYNIRASQSRAVALALERFLDALSPDDRVALLAFPGPDPAVDFTADHGAIREALALVAGVSDLHESITDFNISYSEAVAVETQSDFDNIRRLVLRECHVALSENILELLDDMVTASGCTADVLAEATRAATDIHRRADGSVAALTGLLERLKDVDGRKSLVLVSEGMILAGGRSQVPTMLAELAAEARVEVNVILPQTLVDTNAERRGFQPTPEADQRLVAEGLEDLAVRSKGALFRTPGGLDSAFNRLRLELSGYYALGVETAPSDRDGSRHRIGVEVRRRGVAVRARREFQQGPVQASSAELMTRLLRSPFTARELPIRLTTYAFRDAASSGTRVILAAEIDPAAVDTVDLALGFVVFDRVGRVVASGGDHRTFTSADQRTVEYDGSMLVAPGTYTLRFGAVDSAGNRGSVERPLRLARQADASLALGDLMLAKISEAESRKLKPRVELNVDDPRFAAYLELYADAPEKLQNAEVTLEVARDRSSMTLRRELARVAPRGDGRRGEVLVGIPVAGLAAGRYVVRATVSLAGRPVGTSVRPFELLPQTTVVVEDVPEPVSDPATAVADAEWPPPGPQNEVPAVPARNWVAFDASFVRTEPGSSRKISGRFSRAADGSTREEVDADDPTRAVISIMNIARRIHYRFDNGVWSSYPIKLPPDGFGPEAVQVDQLRFSPAPPIENFDVLRFVNAQGIVQFQTPRLNHFALATEYPAGGREVFSNIRLGDQPAELFEPPTGSTVEARAEWRGAIYYAVGRNPQHVGR